MEPIKPNFIIIGSAKCGTTALASILSSHPDCCMSDPKEISFFQDNMDYKPNPNYNKGWDWYKQAFRHYNGEKIVGEATPSYSDRSRSPNTAKRIYKFNPDMKIIYMVRNPLERQISGWKMQYTFGKEGSSPWRREHKWALNGFNYWMEKQKEVKEWDECKYGFQLSAYEEFFPKYQIKVSFLEDWTTSKIDEIKKIMIFLGLDFSKWDPNFKERANKALDRTIQRPGLKEIRKKSFVKFLMPFFPMSLRNWARKNIAHRKVLIPNANISDTVKQDFYEYVEDDMKSFLNDHGKKDGFWKMM